MNMLNEHDLGAFDYYNALDSISSFDVVDTFSVADMVQEFYFKAGMEPTPQLAASLVEEEYDELSHEYLSWARGLESYKPENELKELSDLIYVLYGYAKARGWDLDEAVKRVHENNMGRMTQDDGTIKRNESGKIMKNLSYPKVDLGDLV